MKPVPRNARNKRFSNPRQRKQQHLLDVKIRVSKERARRIRAVLGVVFKLIVFAAVTAGTWLGGKEALRRFLWENPDYFLRDIRVGTDPNGAVTREQILNAANISEGQNIFTVDLAAARAAIEKLPQIESAEVQRLLPNRMTINVVERQPIAWVCARFDETPSASDRSFLIDARGIVMKSRTILQEYWTLPIISGIEIGNLAPGQRVATMEMQTALELVRLNADNTRFQIRNIDLAKGYCLAVTDGRHARVTFGLENVEKQLARLNTYLDRALQDRRELQTVNLMVEKNTPVTFYEPPPEPPAPAPDPAAGKLDPKSKTVQSVFPPAGVKPIGGFVGAKPASTPASVAATAKSKVATPGGRKSSPTPVKKKFRLNE